MASRDFSPQKPPTYRLPAVFLKNEFLRILILLETKKVYYEKLHATNEFLFDRADRFKIKMPLCDAWQKQIVSIQKQIQEQEEQAARDRIG